MRHTPENCEKIAYEIAESMEREDLIQFMVDDLYAGMIDDKELFDLNVEGLEPNDTEL